MPGHVTSERDVVVHAARLESRGGGSGPAFGRAEFELTAPADLHLDTHGWGKGLAWVNGFCLGRFWSRGPQRTLYVPAPVLRAGRNELLVLERGWARMRGNTARVHHVTIDDHSTTCGSVDALSAATPALTKRLYVDLGHLVAKGLPAPKQPQANALMDNYEGLSLGPRLEDGRHSLIVVSDDNGHTNQVARILVLACT